jgi:3-oxoadipate enol-lactonase
MLPGMFAGGSVERAEPALVEQVRELMLASSVAGVAGALRGMATRPDSLPLLPRVACPTLVVCGAEDTLTPPDEARLMAERIPGARLALLEGAGHLANLEQPAAFNDAVLDFLRALPPTT